MSTPSWKRTASKLDAFHEAVKLRHVVTQIIGRNYGLKRKPYDALVPKNVREKYPDLAPLIRKIDEYQNEVEKARLLTEYDDWIIDKTRNNLYDSCEEMISAIASANEIKCTIEQEYVKRILREDDAICALAKIRQTVQFVEEFFNIDLNRYMLYAEQAELVRKYLYKWKRSTVKEYEKFMTDKAKVQKAG